jgi:hypothetical protein
LLHNRVRCDGLAFPPDRRPMLPWASDPLQGSASVPCRPPERAAGRIAFLLLPKEGPVRSSCRESSRSGYGSTQSVETSCVPRRPGFPTTQGQLVHQSTIAVVHRPSSLRPLSPRGYSAADRSRRCRLPSRGRTGRRGRPVRSSRRLFVASAWRRSTGLGGIPQRGDPQTPLFASVPKHAGSRQCRSREPSGGLSSRLSRPSGRLSW